MFYIWNKMYNVNVHLSSHEEWGDFMNYKYERMREISSEDGGMSTIASAFNEDRARI